MGPGLGVSLGSWGVPAVAGGKAAEGRRHGFAAAAAEQRGGRGREIRSAVGGQNQVSQDTDCFPDQDLKLCHD